MDISNWCRWLSVKERRIIKSNLFQDFRFLSDAPDKILHIFKRRFVTVLIGLVEIYFRIVHRLRNEWSLSIELLLSKRTPMTHCVQNESCWLDYELLIDVMESFRLLRFFVQDLDLLVFRLLNLRQMVASVWQHRRSEESKNCHDQE